MKLAKKSINFIILTKLVLVTMSFFMLRPTFYGQDASTYGLILLLVVVIIQLFEDLQKQRKMYFEKKNILFFSFLLALWLYLSIHILIINSINMEWTLKASLINIAVGGISLYVLRGTFNHIFFKTLIYIFMILTFSYFITVLLSFFVGLNSLFLYQDKLLGESYIYFFDSGKVFFPFTQSYGFTYFGQIVFPKALGFFRESGIFQAFLVSSFFAVDTLWSKNQKTIKFIIVLGILSTLSTAGMAIFMICIIIKFLMEKRLLLGFLSIIVGLFAIYFLPGIGIIDKTLIMGDSINDRINSSLEGLQLLIRYPFGLGFNYISENRNLGINLIGMSSMIGFIGLLLVLLLYFAPVFSTKNKKQYLLILLPLFLTLLTSQPILDAPAVYIFGFINVSVFDHTKSIKISNYDNSLNKEGITYV